MKYDLKHLTSSKYRNVDVKYIGIKCTESIVCYAYSARIGCSVRSFLAMTYVNCISQLCMTMMNKLRKIFSPKIIRSTKSEKNEITI